MARIKHWWVVLWGAVASLPLFSHSHHGDGDQPTIANTGPRHREVPEPEGAKLLLEPLVRQVRPLALMPPRMISARPQFDEYEAMHRPSQITNASMMMHRNGALLASQSSRVPSRLI
jgi:hypothetical protein